MFCNRCGQRNAYGSHYCRHCGAKLDVPGATTPIPDEEYQVPPVTKPEEQPVDHEKVRRLLDKAFELSERNDLQGAALVCSQAAEIDPGSASAHSLLGLLYERLGRRTEAIAEYERVVELTPHSMADRENLRRLKSEVEGLPQAAAASSPSDSAAAEPPVRPSRMYFAATPIVAAASLGVLIILLATPPVRTDKTVVASNSSPATVTAQNGSYVDQGKTHYQQQEYQAAADAFRAALMLNPNDAEARYWLARANQALTQQNAIAQAPPAAPGTPAPAPNQQPATPPQPPAATASAAPLLRSNTYGSNTLPVIPPVRTTVPRTNIVAVPQQPVQPTPIPQGRTETHILPPPRIATDNSDSRIHITTRLAPRTSASSGATGQNGGTAAENGNASAAQPRTATDLDAAFIHQQAGQGYMNNGNYAAAINEFNTAKNLYERQLRSGTRTREAELGVRACDQAVRVCQANLAS